MHQSALDITLGLRALSIFTATKLSQKANKSFLYFNILTMGSFAAAFGELTRRLNDAYDIQWYMLLASSLVSTSVLIGIMWLILVYFGVLNDVFG